VLLEVERSELDINQNLPDGCIPFQEGPADTLVVITLLMSLRAIAAHHQATTIRSAHPLRIP